MNITEQFYMTCLLSMLFIIFLDMMIFTIKGRVVPRKEIIFSNLQVSEDKIVFDFEIKKSYLERMMLHSRVRFSFHYVVKNHSMSCQVFQKYNFFCKKKLSNRMTIEIPMNVIKNESIALICYGKLKNHNVIWAINGEMK